MGRKPGEAIDWQGLQAFRDLTGSFIPLGHSEAVMVLDRAYMAAVLKR